MAGKPKPTRYKDLSPAQQKRQKVGRSTGVGGRTSARSSSRKRK